MLTETFLAAQTRADAATAARSEPAAVSPTASPETHADAPPAPSDVSNSGEFATQAQIGRAHV